MGFPISVFFNQEAYISQRELNEILELHIGNLIRDFDTGNYYV